MYGVVVKYLTIPMLIHMPQHQIIHLFIIIV